MLQPDQVKITADQQGCVFPVPTVLFEDPGVIEIHSGRIQDV